jgi:hypothetical protein
MISGVDTDLDIVSHHTTHAGIDSPDAAVQLISLTSLTGFVMMFGWIGLTCYEQILYIWYGVAFSLPRSLNRLYDFRRKPCVGELQT